MLKVQKVLEAMRLAGCSPDLYTYTILLDACAKQGELEEAISLFQVYLFAASALASFPFLPSPLS